MTLNLSNIILNLAILICALLAYTFYKKYAKTAEENVRMIKADADREAEVRKEALIAAKEAIKTERDRLDEETKERRQEFARNEEKLIKREDSIAEKIQSIAEQENKLEQKKDSLIV